MKKYLYTGKYAPKCKGNPLTINNIVTVQLIENKHKVNKTMKKTASKSTKSATKFKFTINNFSFTLHDNEVILKQYILDRKNQRVGIVVGFEASIGNGPKKTYVGWSKCNVDSGDKFDKDTAIKIAIERAMFGTVNGKEDEADTPLSVVNKVFKMEDRVKRYFKSSNKPASKKKPESEPELHVVGDVYKWEVNNENYRFVIESNPNRARFVLDKSGVIMIPCGDTTITDLFSKNGKYYISDKTFKNICKSAGFTGQMQKV